MTPAVVVCADTASYREVVKGMRFEASGRPAAVPVFSGRGGPVFRGLPAWTEIIPFAEWRLASGTPAARHVPAVAGRFCLCTGDDACIAVGQLLAAAGKELIVCESRGDWETAARCLVLGGCATSLTFVAPMWEDATGRADPAWLRHILLLMRGLAERAAGLSWGIVTGLDAGVMSLQAAKSILQPEIMAEYAAHPTLLLTNDPESGGWPIPALQAPRGPDPVQLVNPQSMPEPARWSVEHAWNAAIFKGHGRSYCAFEGHYCGARDPAADPDDVLRGCVLGTACFDPAWPRIDPRRYDAPVVVLDSCVTGSWASPVWGEGKPSLAFFAAAGSAGAVITSEGATFNASGDYVDLFWSLASAPTIGEATARLNRIRGEANLPCTYYLLGDPDIPAGSGRWPEWAIPGEAMRHSSGNGRWSAQAPQTGAPFVRIPLQTDDAGGGTKTVYVWSGGKAGSVQGCRWVGTESARELWIAAAGMAGGEIEIEQGPWPGVPAGLAEAAVGVPARVATWNPPLDKSASRLVQAAQQVVRLDRMVQQLRNAATVGSPREVRSLVDIAAAEWRAAQSHCVRAAVEMAPRGLWPNRLWQAIGLRSQSSTEPCPHCGLAPTIRRSYVSAPGLERAQWECMRCDLILDQPTGEGHPGVTLQAPERLPPDGSAEAVVTVTHAGGAGDIIGAGAIVVDGTMDRTVRSTPAHFIVKLRTGERLSAPVKLSLEGCGLTPHFYRVRAILLLNGYWFLASRLAVVAEQSSGW
jgi:hypothetical protein